MTELQHWQVLESATILDLPPWMRVVQESVALPNGVVIDSYLLSFERDYAMIVAVDDNDRALVVRQYKHGIGTLLREFPAGYLDEGELPAEAAKRELIEETGYDAATWIPLGAFYVSPGRGPARAHLFLARGVRRVRDPKLDETEELTSELLTFGQIDAMFAAGEMASLVNSAIWGLATARIRNDVV